MCGRLVVYNPNTNEGLNLLGHDIPPHYNAAPSESLPIIRHTDSGEKELVLARWGILPFWAKEPKKTKPFFNTRADNLNSGNKVFWDSRDRHCIVPAGGFYEWSEHDKQPYLIQTDPLDVFYIAGLWRRWKNKDEVVDSFSVITTKPHSVLSEIHHRSPVILNPDEQEEWLSTDYEGGKKLLNVYKGDMTKFKVDPKVVNNARDKGIDSVETIN